MSITACTDLNSKGDILKKDDLCGKDRCKCQKTVRFAPNPIQMEGAGFENTTKK